MTDEQIERSIEIIKEILAQREAAANAKVVDKVMDVADTAVGARERKPRKRKVPSPTSVIS